MMIDTTWTRLPFWLLGDTVEGKEPRWAMDQASQSKQDRRTWNHPKRGLNSCLHP